MPERRHGQGPPFLEAAALAWPKASSPAKSCTLSRGLQYEYCCLLCSEFMLIGMGVLQSELTFNLLS